MTFVDVLFNFWGSAELPAMNANGTVRLIRVRDIDAGFSRQNLETHTRQQC